MWTWGAALNMETKETPLENGETRLKSLCPGGLPEAKAVPVCVGGLEEWGEKENRENFHLV